MPALVAGIHVFGLRREMKTWMAGTSPAMTHDELYCLGPTPSRTARNRGNASDQLSAFATPRKRR
jgi:hypothetical protein